MFSKIPIFALFYYVDYSIVGIFLLLLFNSGEFKHVRLENTVPCRRILVSSRQLLPSFAIFEFMLS